MKTIYLRSIALCLSSFALLSLFAFSQGGGNGGNGGGADGAEPCPPGYVWDNHINECIPKHWPIQTCYKFFGTSAPEGDYYQACQSETTENILMPCGNISPYSPLVVNEEFQCFHPSGVEQ